MINVKARVHSSGLMDVNTSENGKVANNMEKASI
jgi:hypothetical protein